MASPDPKADRKAGGLGGRISLQTLIIASVASAAASFAASRIWGAGTIVSAAATPVVVALVSEFLRRPVQTVAETAKKVPTVQTLPAVKRIIAAPANIVHPSDRSTDTTAASPVAEPPGASTPTTPTPVEEPSARTPTTPTPVEEPVTTTSTADTWRPRWRLAIVTGLLAFAIVVAIYTVPDLLAGQSITGSGQPTTFFGATSTVSKKSTSTTTVTTSAPTTTVTKTSPTATVTRTRSTSTTSTSTSTSTTAATKPPTPDGTQTTTTATTSTTPAP